VLNGTQDATGFSLYRYDWDIGIALACSLECDPALLIFEIWDTGIWDLIPRVFDTNVDLGSRSFSLYLLFRFDFLLLLLVVGFVATFSVVYYQRRKRRRLLRARRFKRKK